MKAKNLLLVIFLLPVGFLSCKVAKEQVGAPIVTEETVVPQDTIDDSGEQENYEERIYRGERTRQE